MGIVRVSGYISEVNHEKYEEMKKKLEEFAKENNFSWMGAEYEEKTEIKPPKSKSS